MKTGKNCRVVCRPNRSEPRITKLSDAVRMALAAKRNGDDACAIAKAVADAVGCAAKKDCSGLRDALEASMSVASARLIVVVDILSDYIATLTGGISDVVEEAMEGSADTRDSAWDRLTRTIRAIVRRAQIAMSVTDILRFGYDMAVALEAFYVAFRKVESDWNALARCEEEEE